MSRQAEPFSIIKRPPSPYWYYKLAGWKTYKSTSEKLKKDAMIVVKLAMEREEADLVEGTVRDYLDPYFTIACPHAARLKDENKSISDSYIKDMRTRMEKYIFPDRLCKMTFADVKRANILDFRSRLVTAGTGSRTVNRTIGILKIICKEAYFREDIDRDPTAGIGEVKYEKRQTGVFTAKELKALFEERPGIWGDLNSYTAFILAAHAGMRRGEILELTWRQVDLEGAAILVDRARTDNMKPKFDKERSTPITTQCVEALKELRSESLHVLPDARVFCYKTGDELGFTWWKKRFRNAMVAAGFIEDEEKKVQIAENRFKTVHEYHNPRGLKPHSFRHSLNTILRDAGFDAGKIRESLGWAGEKVQEGYTDWKAMDYSRQREIVEKRLG